MNVGKTAGSTCTKTRDEADTALSKLTPAVREGTYRPPAELPTLATVARDWFATKAGHRVSSQAGWQVHLDVHIVPTLGKRRIDQIDLAPEPVHALKVWKLACPPGPFNLVFPTEEGTPKHRSPITHHALRAALKAAGLPQVTLHSLRHTCASALILAGTDCLEVAKFLGHAKPTVTMSVYAHWFNTRKTVGTMSTVAGAVFCDSGTALGAASDKGLRDGRGR